VTDRWLDDPTPYLDRDDPRCRRHPAELETNCRLCRSEAIADHNREPENVQPVDFPDRPRRRPPHLSLAPAIPIDSRRNS
jgi:hypothetical protein